MCLFCKIAKHQQDADIIFEDNEIIVFKDINPKAKIHFLIVPKKHIVAISKLEETDRKLISNMIFLAKKIASENGLSKKGYRLLFNVGRGGGQIIDHLHLHLMSGDKIND